MVEEVIEVGAEFEFRTLSQYPHLREPELLAERGIDVEVTGPAERVATNSRRLRESGTRGWKSSSAVCVRRRNEVGRPTLGKVTARRQEPAVAVIRARSAEVLSRQQLVGSAVARVARAATVHEVTGSVEHRRPRKTGMGIHDPAQ